MKKRASFFILIFAVLICFSFNAYAAEPLSTTKDNTVLFSEEENGRLDVDKTVPASITLSISNASDLKKFRNRVNNGETDLCAYLTTDIDLKNEKWEPIGSIDNPYAGTFNGNGYEIYNLYVYYPDNLGGLFGHMENAYLKDLIVSGSVTHDATSGGIVGFAQNTYIINCKNYCDVTSTSTVAAGGIVGAMFSTYDPSLHSDSFGVEGIISGCANEGTIKGIGDQTFVGGISGINSGYITIFNCYNMGYILSTSGPVGGIAGNIDNYGFIACTYNYGETDRNIKDNFGEICGFATGNGGIANSYFIKTVFKDIGIDQSSYHHSIYYYTDYEAYESRQFVDDLNEGNETPVFVYDEYYINLGLPVLYWEKPFTMFVDVPDKCWYTAPVNWAYSNNITTGISDTKFAPNLTCTRGQMVTFLYRAAGSPSVSGYRNPFKDVKSSDYYYRAVLWAANNGITTGTSSTTFSPNMTVSRGQVVTFLWRFDGKPYVYSPNPFRDLKRGAYYENAVLWAVHYNITAGTSITTFSPDASCTRAEIVTFLYRYMR